MTSKQTSKDTDSLVDFIEKRSKNSHLRVKDDLGDGFFRLRASEAQKRQAKQDIRCNEDIVIEMLRNSRDAGAKNIYLATRSSGDIRYFTIIDDGDGLDPAHHKHIFEPYVTSKLDTMTNDIFGVHGRGMALYSIKVNTDVAKVAMSTSGTGCSIYVESKKSELPEKKDQSTFPVFFIDEEKNLAVRGPKNIIRAACEFAIESRMKVNVYVGSPADIASTLYNSSKTSNKELFCEPNKDTKCVDLLSFATDPDDFTEAANKLGLDMSSRTSRRILDGQIKPIPSVLEIIANNGINPLSTNDDKTGMSDKISDIDLLKKNLKEYINQAPKNNNNTVLKLSNQDKEEFLEELTKNFGKLASKYYLDNNISPVMNIRGGTITIKFDIHSQD